MPPAKKPRAKTETKPKAEDAERETSPVADPEPQQRTQADQVVRNAAVRRRRARVGR